MRKSQLILAHEMTRFPTPVAPADLLYHQLRLLGLVGDVLDLLEQLPDGRLRLSDVLGRLLPRTALLLDGQTDVVVELPCAGGRQQVCIRSSPLDCSKAFTLIQLHDGHRNSPISDVTCARNGSRASSAACSDGNLALI